MQPFARQWYHLGLRATGLLGHDDVLNSEDSQHGVNSQSYSPGLDAAIIQYGLGH